MGSTLEEEKPSYWVLICAALSVIAIIVVAGYVLMVAFGDWARSGVFGDSFGVVNSLFSGLAFAGIIFTILLQQNELRLQRQELKLQRAELELTRGEISRSADAQTELTKKQARNNALQKHLLAAQITANRLTEIEIKLRAYESLVPEGSKGSYWVDEISRLRDEAVNFQHTSTKGIDAVLKKDQEE